MKLNELSPKPGSKKARMRVGRGIGSGKGKTGGRGVKGQKSRSGVALNGFEGGQMPLYRRLPKFGFTNPFSTTFAVVNLDRLQAAIDKKQIDAKKTIDTQALLDSGVITSKKDGVKLLGNGKIKDKVTLKIEAASKGAIKAVEKAGGKVEILGVKKNVTLKKVSKK